jgi:hypothetical protein
MALLASEEDSAGDHDRSGPLWMESQARPDRGSQASPCVRIAQFSFWRRVPKNVWP